MLSIQDLIKNKVSKEEKTIILNIEKMGGDLKFRIPTAEELHEYKQRFGDNNFSKIANALIFENCLEPKLNDEVLIQTLNCKEEPIDVVEEIFGNTIKYEILDLITDEMDKESFVKKVEEIKN